MIVEFTKAPYYFSCKNPHKGHLPGVHPHLVEHPVNYLYRQGASKEKEKRRSE